MFYLIQGLSRKIKFCVKLIFMCTENQQRQQHTIDLSSIKFTLTVRKVDSEGDKKNKNEYSFIICIEAMWQLPYPPSSFHSFQISSIHWKACFFQEYYILCSALRHLTRHLLVGCQSKLAGKATLASNAAAAWKDSDMKAFHPKKNGRNARVKPQQPDLLPAFGCKSWHSVKCGGQQTFRIL